MWSIHQCTPGEALQPPPFYPQQQSAHWPNVAPFRPHWGTWKPMTKRKDVGALATCSQAGARA
eukprot:4970945-Prorocentrum_lima.AAC.1